MKKYFCFILMIVLFIQNSITYGQSMGNNQYNKFQNNKSNQGYERGQVRNAVISNENEIKIEVNGLYNLVADNYVAVFNIIQVGENIEQADKLMNNRISVFKQNLKNIGIDTSKIKIDMISFVPKYDIQVENRLFSKSYNEIPDGFELQKNIMIHFKNSSKLDYIVSAGASAEIYDLVKVDYFSTSVQKSLDSLRIICLKEVKSKSKAFEITGFKLDTLKKVISDDFSTTYPPSRYFNYQAFSRPSLNAVKKKSSQPNLKEQNKSTSIYYNQISYDNYDIVINPVVTEPVIQISYSVIVKYFLKQEDKSNNIYYILTPTGEAKRFYPK